MNKIILLGYMGSGKTTIAKLLSKSIQLPYKDLDEMIELEENLSINSIFESKGEIYFRKLEHRIFEEMVNSSESFVLSIGGGTPCYANNHEIIESKNVNAFYLKTSLEVLLSRLLKNKSKRPLISKMSAIELKEFIAKHLFERSFFYNKATNTIYTEGKSPAKIVAEIKKIINLKKQYLL